MATQSTGTTAAVDAAELEAKVKRMYREVAENPEGSFHFEMGRTLAERLGYPTEVLDRIPAGAVESFAGVGYAFGLAALRAGENVLDLGSGSGMDAFFAADETGADGRVVGIDMTREQLDKADRLRSQAGLDSVEFIEGHIEALPFDSGSFDCVVSNGVINLSARKGQVFEEAARVLRPGGRLAISDIVTERELTESIVCNIDLWASCIGGAAQTDTYRAAIESAGFAIQEIKENPEYAFLSEQARNASVTFGVKSVSLIAIKPAV
jgi:arsenite methyltransferase